MVVQVCSISLSSFMSHALSEIDPADLRHGSRPWKPGRIATDPNNVERDKIPGSSSSATAHDKAPALSHLATSLSAPVVATLSITLLPAPEASNSVVPVPEPHSTSLTTLGPKRTIVIDSDEPTEADDESERSNTQTRPTTTRKKRKTKRRKHAPDELDANGFLKDLAHLDVPLPDEGDLSDSANVHQFFDNPRTRQTNKHGQIKTQKIHDCIICRKQNTAKYDFVTDVTTAHRHLAHKHKVCTSSRLFPSILIVSRRCITSGVTRPSSHQCSERISIRAKLLGKTCNLL